MRYIHNTDTDPAFNLAAEEWLLNTTDEDVFMLWRNDTSVIVGYNQNTYSQIDASYVHRKNIPVIRRLTGGGAVFHDLGNINYTFIQVHRAAQSIDFHRFTQPIVDALQQMGIPCQFEGRNDILIQGKKISGNAQRVFKDRVLHHGTLLFASEIADLTDALRVDASKYKDRAVQSIAKRVTNIAKHLPQDMPVETFMDRLMHMIADGADLNDLSLSESEREAVHQLAESKYRTKAWNFGLSPQYSFTNTRRTQAGVVEIHLDVQRGLLQEVRIFGDFFSSAEIRELESLLAGCPHERGALAQRLHSIVLDRYIQGVDRTEFLECLF